MKHSAVWERSRPKSEREEKGKRLNINEVAERIGCSKRSVYNLINEGKLPAISLFESGKGLRVFEAEVENYLRIREADCF